MRMMAAAFAAMAIAASVSEGAMAWETSAAVVPYQVTVQTDTTTSPAATTYVLYIDSGASTQTWGFSNCTTANPSLNISYLYFRSTDTSAKDWYALVLSAKIASQPIRVTINSCTNTQIVNISVAQ